jgi:signal transduction histidine kinase
MNRPWHTWVAFAACLAVVLSAMGWISLTVVRLDRVEQQARHQAEREENVRLALWRMDSTLAPMIAQEGLQPYFSYGAFYSPNHASILNGIKSGDVVIESPLLKQPSAHAYLHFQFGPGGELTSPQVPADTTRKIAQKACATPNELDQFAGRLVEFQQKVKLDDLRGKLPELEEPPLLSSFRLDNNDDNFTQNALPNNSQSDDQQVMKPQAQQPAPQQGQSQAEKQQQLSSAEFFNRKRATEAYANWSTNVGNTSPQILNLQGPSPYMNVSQGVLKPMWINSTLVLARRVAIGKKNFVQGCWLDWPEIQGWLKSTIADLLPNAEFEPIISDPGDHPPSNMLAALPVRLIPGVLPEESSATMSPISLSLLVAWVCVLLAAGAVAALLLGAVTLSERRGSFVSAVTHELRTPLTTFRMYTEMLSEQMVPDEQKRMSYVNTLRVEADRLSHLVENVLSYARLERGRDGGRVENTTWKELLGKVGQRLSERAQQAGMTLQLDDGEFTAEPVRIRTDISAVEQILFNLVDNACKYAISAPAKTIQITAGRNGTMAELRVRDHGPGFSTKERRSLFTPFSKSARQAAHSAPGVGLGLALSRRLARDMGGDLRLAEVSEGGACFVLMLPLAEMV